jgi:hypothetical protein
MASTSLRPLLSKHDLDGLRDLHSTLVSERQELRAGDAPPEELEQNRLAIVQCQWQVSRALIERYLPAPAASTTASA